MKKMWICAAFAALALVGFNACSDLVTSVAAPTVSIVGSKTLTAPTGFKASQGGKRKIALNWDPVGIAKSYRIYSATSPNDEFVQVGESQKPEYEDTVGSGRTYYYKVCSVNYVGDTSEFTTIVSGTSLACPVISSIEAEDNRSTVYWYMENAEAYTSDLRYDLYCQKGGDVHQATVSGDVSSYTFEGLNSNTDYTYYIEAYLASDQTATESSPKVTKDTVAQYNPVPPEFTASQGETTDSINLIITLPTMVQVQTTKTGSSAEVIVDYPLCFKIERKKTDEPDSAYKVIVNALYYNGEINAPSSYSYKAGELIEYKDLVSDSIETADPGQKYDYRVRSCIDANYSKVESYTSDVNTPSRNANLATGWAVRKPSFYIKKVDPEKNQANPAKLSSVTIRFGSLPWDAMGKEADYKFAILQEFTPLGGGTTTYWLDAVDGNFFNSITEVNDFAVTYDLTSDPDSKTGTYQFILYVIPANFTNPAGAVDSKNYLTLVRDKNKISISDDATKPKTDFTIEDGWPSQVKLSWFVEDEVSYSVIRSKSDGSDETEISANEILKNLGMASFPPAGTEIEFTDKVVDESQVTYKSIAPDQAYLYWLKAQKGSGAPATTDNALHAKTLGTAAPVVPTGGYSYEDINVTWPIVMAADSYKITLGSDSETLGSGSYLSLKVVRSEEDGHIEDIVYDQSKSTFSQGDIELNKTIDTSDAFVDKGTISLAIKKPNGYNSAKISGKAAKLSVKASSENEKATTDTENFNVWTIGPAATGIRGTSDPNISYDDDSIKVTWQGLGGADGYAIYRTRDAINDPINASDVYAEANTCIYYLKKDRSSITADGTALASPTISSSPVYVETSDTNYDAGTTYTLIDNYKAMPATGGASQWDKDQSYIGLGVKYNYTIVPVLDSGDATIAHKDTYADIANVASVHADGYTAGFGLNLEASKAEWTDRVVLTWNKPAKADVKSRTPAVYYRKAYSSDAWQLLDKDTNPIVEKDTYYYCIVNSQGNLPTAVTPTAGNCILDAINFEPLEFAVSYNAEFGTNTTSGRDSAYTDYLKKIVNVALTEDETKNVGYMFTLPKIETPKPITDPADYKEAVTWKTYDTGHTATKARAIKPDANSPYILEFKNLNNSSAYKTIVTYANSAANKGTVTTPTGSATNISDNGATGDSTHTVTLTPAMTDSVHNGLLKVQRDYKHWYKISIERKTGNTAGLYKFAEITDDSFAQPEGTITAVSEDYGYRKISDKEFARCIGLIVCDAINQTGVQEGDGASISGASGSFFMRHVGASKTVQWGTNGTDYRHKFLSGNVGSEGTTLVSDWRINISNRDYRSGADGNKLYWLTTDNGSMTVNHTTGLASYKGSVKFEAGEQGHVGWTVLSDGVKLTWKYSFSKDSNSVYSVTGQSNVQAAFPYDLGNDHKTKYTSKNDALPEYEKTYWWKEQ